MATMRNKKSSNTYPILSYSSGLAKSVKLTKVMKPKLIRNSLVSSNLLLFLALNGLTCPWKRVIAKFK